jgi:hypothetical protein
MESITGQNNEVQGEQYCSALQQRAQSWLTAKKQEVANVNAKSCQILIVIKASILATVR